MKRQRGSVFVYSLVVLAALITVLAAIASTERLDVKAASNRKESIKARYAAMAAVQRFIAIEANDYAGGGATTSTTTSTVAQTTGATTFQDDWAQMGSNGEENVVLGDCSFRMQVLDANSFANLNSVTGSPPWLANMPLSQPQIDALRDFTTGSQTQATADGGKDPYYNGLSVPYKPKEGALDTLDELLQVRYFTPATIWSPNTNVVSTVSFTAGQSGQQPTLYDLLTPYSYSPNLKPGPLGQQQPKTSIANPPAAPRQGQQPSRQYLAFIARLPQGLTPQAIAQIMTPGRNSMRTLFGFVNNPSDRGLILDNCTYTTGTRLSGKINLNTASQNVLLTIPNINPDVAQALVTQQQTGYTKMSDCVNVPGYSGAVLANTIDNFTVQSTTFIVRAIGKCGNTTVAIEATVDIVNNTPRLVRVQDVPFTDVIGRWGWSSTTSTETIMKEAS